MFIVIALGGNALLERGQPLEAALLKENVNKAAKVIAQVANQHQIAIVHGNGPQVGLLALQSDAYKQVQPYPFDILDAESQGMIGYLLQQAISNQLPHRSVVTLLSQIIVAADDPAFNHPSKPIGPVYDQQQADAILKQHPQWFIKPDGQHFRRVVPSPLPQRIQELAAIKTLVNEQHIVIVGGGGGIPCIENADKTLVGVEAVIDKDRTAALVAEELNADQLIILTDVDAVYENWGQKDAKPLKTLTPAQLTQFDFAAGSMQPKIQAACQFVQQTHKKAMIGHLTQLPEILAGKAGTLITFD